MEQPMPAHPDPSAIRQQTLGTTSGHLVGATLEGVLAEGERALFDRGDLSAARVIFTDVAQACLLTGPAEVFARAALGLGGIWVHEHRAAADAARVTAWQRRALAALDPGSPLASRLRVRLAAEEDYHRGTSDAVLRLLAEARVGGDPVATVEAASLAHHCLLAPEHAVQRLRLADEMLALAALTNRRVDLVMGLTWRTADLFLLGDRHADRSLRELKQTLNDRPFCAVDFVVDAFEVMATIRAGALDLAEERARGCAMRGQAVGDADAGGWYVAQLVAIRWFQGRIGELSAMLEDTVHAPALAGPDDSLLAALAVSAAHAGDPDLALGALHRLRGEGFGTLTPSSTWLVTLVGAAQAAALLNDRKVAAEAYELLGAYAHLPVMASLAVVCFGSPHDALGVAALAAGEVSAARAHFEAAVDHNERLGHLPALQLSRRHLQEILHPAAGPASAALTCRRIEGSWLVAAGGLSVRVPDCLGMRYLETLVSHPWVDVAAVELAGGAHVQAVAGEVLDEEARQAYRRRARELQARLEEAKDAGDAAAAERCADELDWLTAEVQRATALGGRSRRFVDESERARTAVRKAIRRALDRIRAADPRLADLLEAHLVTGTRCCFQPR